MNIGELMSELSAVVSPDDSLASAVALMKSKRCSCVLITQDGYPKGILTERDVVGIFADAMAQQTIPDVTIGKVMTLEPVCVNQATSLYDALLFARSRKLRHILVVNDDELLVGLVTQTDMMNAYMHLIERQAELESQNQKLHLLSHKDALMNIGNRRAMEVELAYTQATAKRYQKTYAIALIDVDYFKKYNDCYGHQMGDEALQALAVAIKGAMRDTDRVYRYGGEELLLLMPETSIADAVVAAERIRQAVEHMQRPHKDSPLACLTISAGVASGADQPWQSLLKRADEALYQAKETGRNKVVAAAD
jgi:diguanylate cyclase (GGDEF)-like protein